MSTSTTCAYCGGSHAAVCGLIKAIEYFQDGSVRRVEFKTAMDYPQAVIGQLPPRTSWPKSVTIDMKPGYSWDCGISSK
jgi:hypothetical protein